MKISVALTLYNGEKYLQEQLQSILDQTYQVDQLIACDDGSTDRTEDIFKGFVESNNLQDKWIYQRNTNNLGPMKNFIYCAKKCVGDIIFFSDQDDIWEAEKVKKMLEVFEEYPKAEVVSCSIKYVDMNGVEMKEANPKECDGKIRNVSFSNQVRTMRSPGLTLAFKRELLKETEKFTLNYGLTYDLTMGMVAAIHGEMYRIDIPLVNRRIHSSNASSPKFSLKDRAVNYQYHIKGRELQLKHMEVIYDNYGNTMSPTEKKQLNRRIKHTEKTITYLKEHNLLGLLGLCFSINPMNNYKLNFANFLICFSSTIRRTDNAK